MGLIPGCEGVNSTERKGDGFNTGGSGFSSGKGNGLDLRGFLERKRQWVRSSWISRAEKAMGLIPGDHTPTADRRHPTSPLPTANSVGANPVGTNP